MNIYDVGLILVGSVTITGVKAENPEEAARTAKAIVDRMDYRDEAELLVFDYTGEAQVEEVK
jgi:hypothetical protein